MITEPIFIYPRPCYLFKFSSREILIDKLFKTSILVAELHTLVQKILDHKCLWCNMFQNLKCWMACQPFFCSGAVGSASLPFKPEPELRLELVLLHGSVMSLDKSLNCEFSFYRAVLCLQRKLELVFLTSSMLLGSSSIIPAIAIESLTDHPKYIIALKMFLLMQVS